MTERAREQPPRSPAKGGAPRDGGARSKVAKREPRGLARLLTPHDPLTSLVLTMPVFLVYHLGLLLTDLRNGADLVTGLMVQLLDRSLLGYVALTVAVAVGIVLVGRRLRAGHHFEPRALLRVLGESLAWSLVLLFSVGWLTAQLFGASWLIEGWQFEGWQIDGELLQLGPRTLGPIERVVMAAGAGFHEEVVFRVGLFGGAAFALDKLGWSAWRAGLLAAVGSSLVFSAVHYVGSLGDAFTLSSFTFRFLMGLAFVALYRWRGFAVAVYTHTLYDLLVFFVFGG